MQRKEFRENGFEGGIRFHVDSYSLVERKQSKPIGKRSTFDSWWSRYDGEKHRRLLNQRIISNFTFIKNFPCQSGQQFKASVDQSSTLASSPTLHLFLSIKSIRNAIIFFRIH